MRNWLIPLLFVLTALLVGCGPSKHRPIDVYLTVESDYGSPNPPVGSNYLNYGMIITASVPSPLAVGPGTRYLCAGWTGTGSVAPSGSTNTVTFPITENSSITWLWQTHYYLTIDSLYGNPQGAGWYEEGATAMWSVTSPWQGDPGVRYVTSSASGTVPMDESKTVTVTWTTQYQLTTSILPEGGGSIACLPEGPWYDADTPVQLTAIANVGYVFTGWSGDLTGNTNPQNLVMDEPKSAAANFFLTTWAKSYGGTNQDQAYSIQQTSDGGYIVAGRTSSFGAGYDNFWVLKLDSDGAVSWQKRYGGAGNDYATSIQQTSDGGYIVAGFTASFGASGDDFFVLKLNSDGTVAWQKRYGGTADDVANSIFQTSDGGYIVAGETMSFGAGYYDFWVLKLNSDGTVLWQKTYGGASLDHPYSIQQTGDGGYIVAGETRSFGAGNFYDFWVLKLNGDGTILFNPASGASVTDTTTVPVDTNCPITNTAVTGVNTSATITNTSATVTDTNATIEQQAP